MGTIIEEGARLRQYLLGELGQQEQERVEERLLTEADYFEELLITEDELIDQYLSGTLSARELEEFKSHFLSTPERHQKLRFAQTLKKYIVVAAETREAETKESPAMVSELSGLEARQSPPKVFLPPPSPFVSRWMMAAMVLILLAGSFVFIYLRQQSSNRATLEQELASLNNPADQTIIDNAGQPPVDYKIVNFTPGTTRAAGELKSVDVDKNVRVLQIRMALITDEFPVYQAVLQTDENSNPLTVNGLKSRLFGNGKIVLVNLPARVLVDGHYLLKLKGVENGAAEDVTAYTFRVVKNHTP